MLILPMRVEVDCEDPTLSFEPDKVRNIFLSLLFDNLTLLKWYKYDCVNRNCFPEWKGNGESWDKVACFPLHSWMKLAWKL